MTHESTKDPEASRRDFLKVILAAGSAFMVVAVASIFRFLTYIPTASPSQAAMQLAWPRMRLGNINSLEALKPLRFNYPLVNTPNILVKLGVKAENGVGPDGDIVAYSIICQHLGCYFGFQPAGSSPPCDASFQAPVTEGYCCCHGGQYDFAQGAEVIGGPPPRPVPSVQLEYDASTGDIYAVAMSPPTIFGHGPPGTTDPASVLRYDLQGGDAVTQDTLFSGA
jgi:arsenite oxidase small subunit